MQSHSIAIPGHEWLSSWSIIKATRTWKAIALQNCLYSNAISSMPSKLTQTKSCNWHSRWKNLFLFLYAVFNFKKKLLFLNDKTHLQAYILVTQTDLKCYNYRKSNTKKDSFNGNITCNVLNFARKVQKSIIIAFDLGLRMVVSKSSHCQCQD